jgi:hypothetical protein
MSTRSSIGPAGHEGMCPTVLHIPILIMTGQAPERDDVKQRRHGGSASSPRPLA